MPGIFGNLPAIQRALDFHSERHNLIASNLANANTPGFEPKELLRADAETFGNTLRLERTNPEHMPTVDGQDLSERRVVEDPSGMSGLDGNSVSLEREMSKMQANDIKYQGVVRIVAHKLGMLKYAANDGNGA